MAEIERRRERGNYLVREKFLREKFFFTFSLWNVFLTKIIYPQRKALFDENFVQQKFFSLKLTFAEFRLLNRILKGYWKACLVQIVNTSVNLSKHTRIIKLYGPNTSSKLFRTFTETLLQAREVRHNFKKHFKRTILKRKAI